ncbi:hypothetical protein [Antrihabitans spumae]|uniref:Uncharacterized protein n=1 Tax=Antrihabitans spumae TaxID=3373370 RepID=A0ABW7KRJ3_9NOCA
MQRNVLTAQVSTDCLAVKPELIGKFVGCRSISVFVDQVPQLLRLQLPVRPACWTVGDTLIGFECAPDFGDRIGA